jgi:hypothetical protein
MSSSLIFAENNWKSYFNKLELGMNEDQAQSVFGDLKMNCSSVSVIEAFSRVCTVEVNKKKDLIFLDFNDSEGAEKNLSLKYYSHSVWVCKNDEESERGKVCYEEREENGKN